ncbi:hypothetical protein P280DRAFT_387335 [Massarina eburnea CBS 473.64]|uniref:C2H2-type domain-containing protein n=1 Tax=Massarina eburnea CBS 473.64 TaxID=1395130 RepID=A0A6A6SH90_9PLEO|nr:hypothetical protein P280DRAFT_387335 [Massarina eburnea CBS 473.64]
MAIQQSRPRTQSGIFLTLKVLQFVHQLRRRLKHRSDHPSSVLSAEGCLGLESKAPGSFAKLDGLPHAGLQSKKQYSNHASDGVCKSRNKHTGPRPRLRLQTAGEDNAAIQNISRGEMQHVLDSADKLGPPGSALSAVARSEELFLRQTSMHFEALSLSEISQHLVLVHDAIDVLCACRSQHDDQWLVAQGLDAGLKFDETFLANYEHLLFRLQTELIHALERKVLEALLLGGRDQKQHRLLSWFTEFAEKPRPLSTFPWTIKPSLAVLWGVCWMFYNGNDGQNAQRRNPRVDAVLQHVAPELGGWDPPGSMDLLTCADLIFGRQMIGTSPQPGPQQQQQFASAGEDRGLGLMGSRNANRPAACFPTDLECSGGVSLQGQALPTSPILTLQGPRHERTSSINSNSNFPTPVSMGGNRSPLLSPVGDRRLSTASSMGPIRQMSEDRSSVTQDGDDAGSPRRNHVYKRSEEPPRNHEGKMVCKHSECTSLTFDRKCEWSKHMDKHDRPYKCNAQGCEKLQGFTYSGGLLRHQREVHKLHGGIKTARFCPFVDCKRSSGSGFTRKENLAEHVRRVHRRTSMSADLSHLIIARSDSINADSIADMRMPSEAVSLFARIPELPAEEEVHNPMKRKRMSEAGIDSLMDDDADLRNEIKRLRRENEEKDARLRQLEAAVMALQQGRR